ncbi:hypothetical protein [Allocoleopsis sp.]|uniref:hypothetical protein n=1 Tax=Allocoleopsis sp. TaxID=3088169 RepID=UPI002FD63AD0
MFNPIRSRIQRFKNRRRLRRLGRRAKGAGGYAMERIKDGLVETAGVGLITGGLAKARGLMPKVPTPRPFSRGGRLVTFKKKHLSKQHRARISASLKGQSNIDQHLRRGETAAKIFRSYAGGVRSLAAAKEYVQKVGRTDSGLRRLDRLSAIAGRARRGFR